MIVVRVDHVIFVRMRHVLFDMAHLHVMSVAMVCSLLVAYRPGLFPLFEHAHTQIIYNDDQPPTNAYIDKNSKMD